MAEFTLTASIACLATIGYLVACQRPLLRSPVLWISYAIILFFEALMDGWLTKLSAPIIVYEASAISGIRFPFDIPVEDFLFGFPLVMLPVVLWLRSGRSRQRQDV